MSELATTWRSVHLTDREYKEKAKNGVGGFIETLGKDPANALKSIDSSRLIFRVFGTRPDSNVYSARIDKDTMGRTLFIPIDTLDAVIRKKMTEGVDYWRYSAPSVAPALSAEKKVTPQLKDNELFFFGEKMATASLEEDFKKSHNQTDERFLKINFAITPDERIKGLAGKLLRVKGVDTANGVYTVGYANLLDKIHINDDLSDVQLYFEVVDKYLA